jgi:chemotaxis protein methyltransferase CheR
MENVLLQQFLQLLAGRTGLQLRPHEVEQFRATVLSRAKWLKLPDPAYYYQILASSTADSEGEWRHLIGILTNRESYFFRDKGQIAVLKREILPELIEHNRRQRTLHIWSAGCSTGEEPYSLAILVSELLPRRAGWRISILGSDINEEVLDHARRGIYTAWSFRMVDPDLQQRYFHQQKGGFQIDPQIASMVAFCNVNLSRDRFPSRAHGLQHMDLIVCRNVFIYFNREVVPVVLGKFADTLVDHGYLMTGHAEIHHPHLPFLAAKRYPESVVYQRVRPESKVETDGSQPAISRHPPAPVAARPPAGGSHRHVAVGALGSGMHLDGRKPAAPLHHPVSDPESPITAPRLRPSGALPGAARPAQAQLLSAAEAALRSGDYGEALGKAEALLDAAPRLYPALCLAAEAYASVGEHARAIERCRQAMEVDPFGVPPYQVLAAVSEEKGEIEEAKNLLRKVLYLAPSSAAAYLELGALYAREGDATRARKMRASALELLQGADPDAPVESYGEVTTRDMARHVQQLLGEGD